MDERLRTVERDHRVFLTSEARECGYDDRQIRRMLQLRIWYRVRHGAYCFFETWAKASDIERHLILAHAVIRAQSGPVALSHVTSLAAQGVALWGADLSRVHLTRLDGGVGRTTRDTVHHEGRIEDGQLVERGGLVVTHATQAVLEAATLLPVEAGLVSADSAQHLGLTSRDELARRFGQLHRWPGTQKLHLVVSLADGRAESVGETRTRFLCWRENLPRPVLQYAVCDANGVLIGHADFAWPDHGVLMEFDGKQKYGRLLRPGADPTDVVFAEKRREDLMREITGWWFIRLIWADLQHPSATAARIARLLRLAA
jgi:hypothetical protein